MVRKRIIVAAMSREKVTLSFYPPAEPVGNAITSSRVSAGAPPHPPEPVRTVLIATVPIIN